MSALADDQPNPDAYFLKKGGPPGPTALKPFEAVIFAERRRDSPEAGGRPQCFEKIGDRIWLCRLIEMLRGMYAVRIQVVLGQAAEMGKQLLSEVADKNLEIVVDPDWQTHTRLASLALLTFGQPPKRILLIDGNNCFSREIILKFRRFWSPCIVQCDIEARFGQGMEMVEFDADFKMVRMGRDLPHLDCQGVFTGLIKLDGHALMDLFMAARDPQMSERLVDLPGAMTELAKLHPVHVLNEDNWHPLCTEGDLTTARNRLK